MSAKIVQEFYLAYYGRPADPAGLDFWVGELAKASGDTSRIVDAFGTSAEATILFAGKNDTQKVNAIFQQLFGRDADPVGLSFYLNGLSSNSFTFQDVARRVLDGAQGNDRVVIANKQTVADGFTQALRNDAATAAKYVGTSAISAVKSLIASVDASESSLSAAQAQIATVLTNVGTGATFNLTTGPDSIVGTSGDDTFVGHAKQNISGQIANSFATGDFIDGGAGTDKLVISTVREMNLQDSMWLSGRTVNVEQVYLNALSPSGVDAGMMDSVEQFWSDGSRSWAIIDDVRLGSKLKATRDITFAMKDVDHSSSLYAAFDSNSLKDAGSVVTNAQLQVRIADVSAASPDKPLANVNMTLGFSVGGTAYTLENLRSNDGTYTGLIEAVKAALAQKGLGNLVVTAGEPFASVTVAGNTTTLPFTAEVVLITNPAGAAFSNVTFTQSAIEPVPDGFLVAGTAAPVAPATASTLVETIVLLDNAGRGSTAGDVYIGGRSDSKKVVEKANVIVEHSSKINELSSASAMRSDNNNWKGDQKAFKEIVITSGSTKGDLSIANVFNTARLDATAFGGSKLAVTGNITSAQEANYNWSTGASEDTLTINYSNSALAKTTTGLNVSTGGGADKVSLTNIGSQSFNTMNVLKNVKVDTGAGADTITITGNQRIDVLAGGDSDFVHFDSGAKGAWQIGNLSGSQPFSSRVLYKAELTVTFAGFESKVMVETTATGNFTASQKTINEAIEAAIKASPELAKLLKVTPLTANQAIKIESTVGGLNNLSIKLNQPSLSSVSPPPTGSVATPTTTDLVALKQGLINTAGVTSRDLQTVTQTEGVFNPLSGNLQVTGVAGSPLFFAPNAGGSADASAPTDLNFSVVDMGTGSNDLLVLHSNDLSAKVIKFSGAFGKVSVVNFHDISPDQVSSKSHVGLHALDFTAFLNGQRDRSSEPANNDQSKQAIPVSLNIVQAAFTDSTVGTANATANSVNMLRMDEGVANSAKFSDLTAAQLLTVLNTAPGTGVPVLGGITNATLSAANYNPTLGTLIGSTLKYVVMVENVKNPGEYKVFELSAAVGADGTTVTDNKFASANLLGTVDFGASINFQVVGSPAWNAVSAALRNFGDGTISTSQLEAVIGSSVALPVDPPVTPPAGGRTDVNVTDLANLDASAGSFNYIVNFSGMANPQSVARIAGYGADDRITLVNAPAGSSGVLESNAATRMDLGYGDASDFNPYWVVSFTGLDAATVTSVNSATGFAAKAAAFNVFGF